MKLIESNATLLGAVPTDYAGALRAIEFAGRTCYKSEDKITDDSAEAFVRKLAAAGHYAMIEHSNFVVRVPVESVDMDIANMIVAQLGKYLDYWIDADWFYAGGNLTAWYYRAMKYTHALPPVFTAFAETYAELLGLAYTPTTTQALPWGVCPHEEIPDAVHRYQVRFICDRGVSHELVRHRPCSFAQESTRYVNYANKPVQFVKPAGFNEWPLRDQRDFFAACESALSQYLRMLDRKFTPQQARAVLPNALKTEVIVTTNLLEWDHIFTLRCHPSAHPDFVRIAVPLRQQFIDANLM